MLTPGDYLRLRREAAGLSVEDVAHRLATTPHELKHRDRSAWLKAIEDGIAPLSNGNAILLRFLFNFDPVVLDALDLQASGVETVIPAICRLCGCSQFDACGSIKDPCGWADEAKTVCTTCATLFATDDLQTSPGTIPPVASPEAVS